MPIPQHTRPFNLEHAKAGAPFCGDNGQPIKVFAWDRTHPTHPIVGMETEGEQEVIAFRSNGNADHGIAFITSRLVMTPLGFIDGKPVFVGDEILYLDGVSRKAEPGDDLAPGNQWRWPAPAPVYPQTRMVEDDYASALNGWMLSTETCCVIANAALRHAIEAKQVLLPFNGTLINGNHVLYGSVEAVDHFAALLKSLDPRAPTRAAYDQQSRELGNAERLLEELNWRSNPDGGWSYVGCGVSPEGASMQHSNEERAARDMAIAEAVRQACKSCVTHSDQNVTIKSAGPRFRMVDLDLAAIIAGVKS